MKLKDGIIQTESNGVFYLVDSGASGKRFNGMIKLNETGAFIAKLLTSSTDEETIITEMCREYDVPRDKAAADVEKLVSALEKVGLIER